MNGIIPSKIDIQIKHELLAILGLCFLLGLTVYLLPLPALGTAGA